MTPSNQEYTARRFQSFDIANVGPSYDAGYDCQLPAGARTELLRPKRARILTRPPAPPQKPSWLDYARSWFNAAILGLCGLLFLVALCAVASWFSAKHERQLGQPIPSVHTAPVVQPALAATPAATPASASTGIVPVPVPRAQLVKLPAPRAKLVRLPFPRVELVELAPSHIDETHVITMPYGMIVRATLRGFLENENQLPRVGRIGDMYVVGNIPWIWIQVPGTPAPTWVDP